MIPDDVRRRAMLAYTEAGQHHAGLNAALAILDAAWPQGDARPMTDPITAAYRAGLEAAAAACDGYFPSDFTPYEVLRAIRAAIRALPVPAPDPMVVTVRLEWEEGGRDTYLTAGGLLVGHYYQKHERGYAVAPIVGDDTYHPTEAEARDALLAAVRKALGAGE